MAYQPHLGVNTSGRRPWMARDRPQSHPPGTMLPPRRIPPASRLRATLPGADQN